jgi:hypothetical protein
MFANMVRTSLRQAGGRAGKIPRLFINMPLHYPKSLFASIAFPARCLRHEPVA